MGHTPGPWTAIKAAPNEAGATIAWVGDWAIVLADEPSYEFHGPDDDDALLVAAAPDILGALTAIRDLVKRNRPPSPDEIFGITIAAIAKAKGE